MDAVRWPQLVRFFIALIAEILLCASWNWFDDWTLQEMPVKFVAAGLQAGIACVVAVREFPVNANPRFQAVIFWIAVIALRLVVLPLQPGDDLYRYQWEGKVQQAGFNPYVVTPDDPRLAPIRAELPAAHKINQRDFRPIHPPGAELIFAGLSRISDSPLLYKLLFAVADLAAIALLLRLLGDGSRYAGAAWYAWNPLVVHCFAGSAHFDSLMILALMAGILCLTRLESIEGQRGAPTALGITAEQDTRRKWWLALGASAAFGIAISIKLVPALLLIVCAFALRRRAVALFVAVAIPALLSLFYGYPGIPVWESLLRVGHVRRLNDLFWWLIEETAWPNPHQRNYHYHVVLVIGVAAVSFVFWRNWKRGMLWAVGTALILSPVLHPWDCTWILPLAAWRRSYAWFILSITLFAYFLFWNERLFLLPWRAEPWQRALIILPAIGAALILGLRQKAERDQAERMGSSP
jgi:alpha-1,6-mannosyltransferase